MSKARKLLDAMKRRGADGNWLIMKDGEAKWVRLRPPYGMKDEQRAENLGATFDRRMGVLICNQHRFLPVSGKPGTVTNYRCLQDVGEDCNFCRFFEGLKEGDADIKRQHGKAPCGMIDLWVKKIGKFQRFFKVNKTNLEKLYDLFDFFPNINDPQTGRLVLLSRIGDDLNTVYRFKPSQKETVFDVDSKEWPDIMGELQNMAILKPAQIAEVLRAKFGRKVKT